MAIVKVCDKCGKIVKKLPNTWPTYSIHQSLLNYPFSIDCCNCETTDDLAVPHSELHHKDGEDYYTIIIKTANKNKELHICRECFGKYFYGDRGNFDEKLSDIL